MRLKVSRLRLQARAHTCSFDMGREVGGALCARAKPDPDNTHEAAALERAELAELDFKSTRDGAAQALGEPIDEIRLNAAEEADSDVEIGGWNPAEGRRPGGALGEIAGQHITLLLGDRQAEEDAQLQRTAFFQWTGAHVLGAVGRQP